METLLEVKNLSVRFPLPGREVLAVRDVSFVLNKGMTLGLVGESGCGKSVTAYSILDLVASPGVIDSGEILYCGQDLTLMGEKEKRKIRGREIAMIFQEPMSSLNPVFTVGYQISESVMLHSDSDKKTARERSIGLLKQVGIPDPEKRFNSYPHEFSGGMCQRAMIAMALAASPEILIADEPTTALDVTIQAQILDLLMKIQQERSMSLLLITHDLGIVSNIADSIAVMYAGEIVEYGATQDIFNNPSHPYTRGLFEAIPRIGQDIRRLKTIPGVVPVLASAPGGCVFADRCSFKKEECLEKIIQLEDRGNGHCVRCIRKDI